MAKIRTMFNMMVIHITAVINAVIKLVIIINISIITIGITPIADTYVIKFPITASVYSDIDEEVTS